jgi:hypothetical protein
MIRHLSTGRRTPGTALKERLAKVGVEPGTWTMPVAPDAEPKLTPAADAAAREVERKQEATSLAGDVERSSAIALLVASIAEIEQLIGAARLGSPAAPLTHVASLMRVKVNALDRLARLRGEGDLTVAMIRRSEAWHEILAAIEGVLAKHPEAARDFAEEMERLS